MAEVEAKFLIRKSGEVERVLETLRALGCSVEERSSQTHLDTYYDTADFSILSAGWTCRCRQRGSRRLLTLKASGVQDGSVFVREEIEQVVPQKWLLAKGRLPPGPVRDRLEPLIGRRQRHKLFTIKNRRGIYAIATPDGKARLELDLDRAQVAARRPGIQAIERLSFTELELELLSGADRAVRELAKELHDRLHLVASRFSKFDRGLRVAGLRSPSDAAVGPSAKLKSSDPLQSLLHSYLMQQLDAIRYYEPIAWEGLDPEGVHKMRVAIRRTRAIVGVFADLFDPSAVMSLDDDLRELARQLGRARDADICEDEIRRFYELLPSDAVLAAEPYADHLRRTTVDAYSGLNALLESSQYSRVLARLEKFVSQVDAGAVGHAASGLTIEQGARKYVGDIADRIIKRGDGITVASTADEVHKLRIRAKRLRYLLDFFSAVQTKKWLATIAELQKLQDLLGAHQDAVTARHHIEEYLAGLPGERTDVETLLAIGRLLQIQDSRIVDCRRRLPATWRRFKRTLRQKGKAL